MQGKRTSSATYRPDIGGLRAIAVLSVVAFHFGAVLPGGFAGVDVFFVISGFLITSIIAREASEGSFSLLAFYGRRMRRVAPALLVVVVATLVAGWVLLIPADFAQLGIQAATAAFGASNFYFASHVGYFDRAAELQPLLHTWSLGVEEQFYLLWPVLVLGIRRFGGKSRAGLVAATAAIAIVSLGVSIVTTITAPQAAFYLLPARAFELAIGALIALAPIVRVRWLAELMPAAGLALIAWSVARFDNGVPLAGLTALLPCLGAALIVWPPAHRTTAARLLAVRPLVFIGVISYSIYLWHWPLLAFFRQYAPGAAPTFGESAALLGATLVLAVVTWRFVEIPGRRIRWRSVATLATGLTAMAAVALAGLAVVWQEGVPSRLPAAAARYAGYIDERPPEAPSFPNCFETMARDDTGDAARQCLAFTPGAGTGVLLVGDSHANHFRAALAGAFPDVQFRSMTASGCRPVIQPVADDDTAGPRCRDGMRRLFGEILPGMRLDVIILSARWSTGEADQIRATVDYLQRFADRVIVFGQTIEYDVDVPILLTAEWLPRRSRQYADYSRYNRYEAMSAIDAVMRSERATSTAGYHSPLDVICPDGKESCRLLTTDDIPFQRDYGHFTGSGAREVVAGFRSQGLDL